MEQWDILYLIASWTYIFTFHLTYTMLTLGAKDVETLRLIAALD